jgi:hemerythrin
MQVKWTEDFSVGVGEIDRQHKELFARINDLDSALRQGKAKEEVLRLIDFLDEYAVSHFAMEEGYMSAHDYPNYPQHKTEHSRFKAEFADIKRRFATGGRSQADTIGLCNNLLITWFCNHIRTVDMSLGSFLKAKLASDVQ